MIDAEDKLKRLYQLVEDGVTDVDEVLKERLNTLKGDRDRAKAALERAKEQSASQIQIDPALIERFGRTMRENFTASSVPFRKAYLQSLIDVIEVDDHQVRIKGSKDVLEKAVLASPHPESWCSQTSTRWRPEEIRTPDPQIRSLCQPIDFATSCSESPSRALAAQQYFRNHLVKAASSLFAAVRHGSHRSQRMLQLSRSARTPPTVQAVRRIGSK